MRASADRRKLASWQGDATPPASAPGSHPLTLNSMLELTMTHPLCQMAADGRIVATPLSSPLSAADKRTGVYCIWMPADPKHRVYVGQTGRGIAIRTRQHRTALRDGRHPSRQLQATYAKYGDQAFVWSLVEALPADVQALTAVEQRWMDAFPRRLFNAVAAAGSTLGFNHSADTRARLSAMSRAHHEGKTADQLEDWKAKVGAASRATHAAFTDAQRAERAAKISAGHVSKSDAEKRTVSLAISARRRAETQEQRAACSAKTAAAHARKTPEQRAAEQAKKSASLRAAHAAKTETERAAVRAKQAEARAATRGDRITAHMSRAFDPKLPIGARAKSRAYVKKYAAHLLETPESTAARIACAAAVQTSAQRISGTQKMRATKAALTAEQRAAVQAKRAATMGARTPEEVAARAAKYIATMEARTAHQVAARRERIRAALAARTPEQKAEASQKMLATRAANKAANKAAKADKETT